MTPFLKLGLARYYTQDWLVKLKLVGHVIKRNTITSATAVCGMPQEKKKCIGLILLSSSISIGHKKVLSSHPYLK